MRIRILLFILGVGSGWTSGCADGTAPAGPHLVDLTGRRVDFREATGAGVNVFLFTRSDCPISNRYAPEVKRLQAKFASRGVAFRLVYLDRDETTEALRRHMKEYDYKCEALRDPRHELVKLTGARVTPEAAVFVPGGNMIYRGRIDDRYVDFGKARLAPSTRDLEEALEAALEGKPVTRPTTRAVGCVIEDLR